MTLHEKIRQVRKAKGVSLQALEERLISIFGKKALRYNTLYRIEKGLRQPRVASLSQICIGLGVSIKDIKEGTEEESFSHVDIIHSRDKVAQYVYSEKAYAHILSKDKQPFLALRLILLPTGLTKLEQDPGELGKFEKWVYVTKGKLTCVVGEEKIVVKKDESLCFESSLPHYFQNNTPRKCACIIIQNPKHI